MKAKRKSGSISPLSSETKGFTETCNLQIHPEMKDFLGYCLFKLALRIRTHINESVAKYEIVAPQCAILSLIDSHGPLTQVEIGAFLGIDKATMVRFLDGLEENGFVVRETHAKDRRAKVLRTTPTGKKVLEKVHRLRKEAESNILSPLTGPEQKKLRALIAKLVLQTQSPF